MLPFIPSTHTCCRRTYFQCTQTCQWSSESLKVGGWSALRFLGWSMLGIFLLGLFIPSLVVPFTGLALLLMPFDGGPAVLWLLGAAGMWLLTVASLHMVKITRRKELFWVPVVDAVFRVLLVLFGLSLMVLPLLMWD